MAAVEYKREVSLPQPHSEAKSLHCMWLFVTTYPSFQILKCFTINNVQCAPQIAFWRQNSSLCFLTDASDGLAEALLQRDRRLPPLEEDRLRPRHRALGATHIR